MNKENNMELKSEYVEVEVLGYGLPLYNAIGSSGDKVIYEGIEYDSTMINAWEVSVSYTHLTLPTILRV